jgi:hypothetical protein
VESDSNTTYGGCRKYSHEKRPVAIGSCTFDRGASKGTGGAQGVTKGSYRCRKASRAAHKHSSRHQIIQTMPWCGKSRCEGGKEGGTENLRCFSDSSGGVEKEKRRVEADSNTIYGGC